jgi:predicted amidophosphoribosyltransferase
MKANSTESSAQDEAKSELEVCISCLKTNSPGTAFCRHCGTPLTSYAATAPFESIFAEGDFWRKAVRRAKGKPLRRILILLFLVLLVLSILLGFLLPR